MAACIALVCAHWGERQRGYRSDAQGICMRRTPSHAGRLSRWERHTFAVVFTLMGTFVAVGPAPPPRAPPHASALPSSTINGSVPAGPAATPAQAPLAGNGGGT